MALLLLRVFYLRLKANSMHSDSFKNMDPRDKLAVLKECLLNNPTKTNLENLREFTKAQGIEVDVDSYKPFMDRQLQLLREKNAIAEDNELYAKESAWMDKMLPLEFAEAETAKKAGDNAGYIERSLEGISRLYSDEAIVAELSKLVPLYEKAASLVEGYNALARFRDECGADDKSLAELRKRRDAWMEDLLTIAKN